MHEVRPVSLPCLSVRQINKQFRIYMTTTSCFLQKEPGTGRRIQGSYCTLEIVLVTYPWPRPCACEDFSDQTVQTFIKLYSRIHNSSLLDKIPEAVNFSIRLYFQPNTSQNTVSDIKTICCGHLIRFNSTLCDLQGVSFEVVIKDIERFTRNRS
jgi:hypothetical protein